MDSQLRMRRLATSTSESTAYQPGVTSEYHRLHDQAGAAIIQEIKTYGPYVDPTEMPSLEARVSLLAELLGTAKATTFRSLRCADWTHQHLLHSYQFDFIVPSQFSAAPPTTLQSAIDDHVFLLGPQLRRLSRALAITIATLIVLAPALVLPNISSAAGRLAGSVFSSRHLPHGHILLHQREDSRSLCLGCEASYHPPIAVNSR